MPLIILKYCKVQTGTIGQEKPEAQYIRMIITTKLCTFYCCRSNVRDNRDVN